MEIGTVIGSVWATKKADGINGKKLLVVELRQGKDVVASNLQVAVDVIGAGIGDMVLLCRGNPARMIIGDGKDPIDAAVVGIVDSLDIQKDTDGGTWFEY